MKRILAIGKIIRRYCVECDERTKMTQTETADGWEIWTCQQCGNVERFRTR